MATTAAQRTRAFFGRRAELAELLELAEGGPTRVISIHGIAGIGKSALLGEFVESARDRGATVLALDCRAVEPTERGFLTAIGFDDIGARASGIEAPAVIVLDHYEVFRLMDTWLRQVLVPNLPSGFNLVLSGRSPAGSRSAASALFRSARLPRTTRSRSSSREEPRQPKRAG